MISFFKAPAQTVKDIVITKKLFSEQMRMTSAEKRLLKDDIHSITMRMVLQPQTIGLQAYETDEYQYHQIVVSEVCIRKLTNFAAIAALLQRAFPYPLILLLECEGQYKINWADKRINQADKSKRVVENMEFTRWMDTATPDKITEDFCRSLDVTRGSFLNLKDLFDTLKSRFFMLAIADETGCFKEAESNSMEHYRATMTALQNNRNEQDAVMKSLKTETHFNEKLKLTEQLKQLQVKEKELKEGLN